MLNLKKMMGLLQDYLELCKPKVVVLMLVTVLVGMVLAGHQSLSFTLILNTLLGVACCAGSAAAINHWLDRRLDAKMQRTARRPVVQGRITGKQVVVFAVLLAILGVSLLALQVNFLTAELTLLCLIGYAIVYTGFLKRATTQNIVIGGLAGAAPPLLGWTAVSNHIDPQGLLLVLIIFVWTPPHFWALSLYRLSDYQNIAIPMFPVVYGEKLTRFHVLLYVILLLIVTLFPYLIGMSGLVYLLAACVLNIGFLYWAYQLNVNYTAQVALQMFKFSIVYLFGLFMFLIIDHYV